MLNGTLIPSGEATTSPPISGPPLKPACEPASEVKPTCLPNTAQSTPVSRSFVSETSATVTSTSIWRNSRILIMSTRPGMLRLSSQRCVSVSDFSSRKASCPPPANAVPVCGRRTAGAEIVTACVAPAEATSSGAFGGT
jgi:hypothetical protein